ncbi:sensor histidine kinase [Virgibacillus halodenitrificans]|uniref:sensor histidine kinase n=1 Tax=Virgibacillus halodenitrificans TaxID=1482 RepID=UPI000EF4F225|nr:HAMP domain-containing sensor histidine kinase [Virgibacillus halodenitrificans]
MYVIGILVILIGVIPAVLGLYFKKIFKETRLATPLSLFMILIFVWQVDIGVLYFYEFLPEGVILFLFKLFRGAIFTVLPLTIYISYSSYSRNTYINKEKTIMEKVAKVVISKPVFIFSLILSIIAYFINWSVYGVTDIYMKQLFNTGINYYYPLSGMIGKNILISLIIITFLVLFCSCFSIRYISNKPLRQFMKTFVVFSFLLIMGGVLNLVPNLGSLVSTIFVIAFTAAVMIAFVRMYISQLNDYTKLLQREKKLDYLGGLSASLIHEIRNPLHLIKNYSYIIKETQDLNEKGKKMFSYIDKSTDHLGTIVESFTNYMETELFEMKIEDLNEVIEHAIELTRGNLNEYHTKVNFNSRYENIKVPLHKGYITQVFVNLIKNSAESIPEERTERTITIDIEFVDDYIEVNLRDTGKGIPSENWNKIFDPFISNKKRGMGLGLSLSKKIMLEHQGDLIVEDSNSYGTQFRIRIPKNSFNY